MLEQFDAVLLARLQFAFTVSFHFIFPSFTIGLASYLAVLEGLWLRTGREIYLALFNYWLKIFAIAFGMGVVSGIVLTYQFGTNWSVFSDKAGPIVGPLMAQGNRVKESCGDEACEEVVVPCSNFALEAERVLTGGSSDQVVGHVP